MSARMHPEDLRAFLAAVCAIQPHAIQEWSPCIAEADALLSELAKNAKPSPAPCSRCNRAGCPGPDAPHVVFGPPGNGVQMVWDDAHGVYITPKDLFERLRVAESEVSRQRACRARSVRLMGGKIARQREELQKFQAVRQDLEKAKGLLRDMNDMNESHRIEEAEIRRIIAPVLADYGVTEWGSNAFALMRLRDDVRSSLDDLQATEAELEDEKAKLGAAELKIAELEAERLRFYRPDGSFEVLDSREDVVARRIDCARLIQELQETTADMAANLGSLKDDLAFNVERVFRLSEQRRALEADALLLRAEHSVSTKALARAEKRVKTLEGVLRAQASMIQAELEPLGCIAPFDNHAAEWAAEEIQVLRARLAEWEARPGDIAAAKEPV